MGRKFRRAPVALESPGPAIPSSTGLGNNHAPGKQRGAFVTARRDSKMNEMMPDARKQWKATRGHGQTQRQSHAAQRLDSLFQLRPPPSRNAARAEALYSSERALGTEASDPLGTAASDASNARFVLEIKRMYMCATCRKIFYSRLRAEPLQPSCPSAERLPSYLSYVSMVS